MKAKEFFTAKRIAMIAVFAALTTVATIVIAIPISSGAGFVNVGDTVIFLCAALMDPISALLVGGLGSAIGDLLLGYAAYAPFTLVVKGLEGLVAALLIKLMRKKIVFALNYIVAFTAGGVCMTAGYCFTADLILYGWAAAVASVPANLIQAAVSIVIATALAAVLGNMKVVRDFMPKTGG